VTADISRFLSKGGVILGIAAFSQSRQLDCGPALGPALFEPATQLLELVEDATDMVSMANAARLAAAQQFPVAMSSIVKRCATDRMLRAFVGDGSSCHWPPGTDSLAPTGAEGGLIVLAMAVCRNADLIKALSALIDISERERFKDLAQVAAVLSPPGEPSRMRQLMKKRVLAHDAAAANAREA
jgi:hypothetical protein